MGEFRYADVFVCKSSNPSDELQTTRLNTYSANNAFYAGDHPGVRVDCVASGYSQYDQIKFKVRRGRFHIMGLGFSHEVDRPVAPLSFVHSENVIGDPASLSDFRLKQDQSTVPSATMAAIVDAVGRGYRGRGYRGQRAWIQRATRSPRSDGSVS